MQGDLQKLKHYLRKPFFYEKVDRFLIFPFVFLGSFGSLCARSAGLLFLEMMILAILVILILSFILRLIGNQLRKKKG